MNAMTDAELLQAYVERQSEPAFAELVNRHLGLVYAGALRQVQRPDVAADVTQAVFLLLARKASALRREVILSGWLFRTTRFLATRARRTEQRRQQREQEAAVMNLQNETSPQDDTLWREISPHLDDAVAALSESDRRAVLLRFFERKPLRDVGGQLGLSEDAAKKRVSRAVDKLREFLASRGVTLSGVALGGTLLAGGGQAAPAGLAQTISTALGAGAATTSATIASLVAGGMRDWLWWQTRSLLPWAVGATAVMVGAALLISKPATGVPVPRPPASQQLGTINAASSDETVVAVQPSDIATATSERQFVLNIVDRQNNQPIAGARVVAQIWGAGEVNQSTEKETGADGSCVFNVLRSPSTTFRVWLSAPSYVPLVMDWQAYEFSESDVFHVSRLTRGVILSGEVLDEGGLPVAEAKITFGGPGIDMTKRENIGFLSRFSATMTDEVGRFHSDQMPPEWVGPGGISVGVAHPNFASETFWINDPKQFATNHLVTLTPGVALRGVVIGPRGDPVPGVGLQEDEKRFGLETKSDYAGRFEFPHVQPGAYTLTARTDGYAELKRTLRADTNGTEVTLQLTAAQFGEPQKRKPNHLVGSVVDAENQEPITRFRVLLNERRDGANRLLGEAVKGAFDWTTELGFVREFSLIVEAEGYAPQKSDVRPIDEPEQKFEFRLQRGSDLTGVVLQPDGQPATNASVSLAADGKYTLRLADGGKLVNWGDPVNRSTTDERGRFSLRTMVGAERLLVAHASGCAVLPIASVTNVLIPLQPWGTIEGRLAVGGEPATNQPVNVGFGVVPGQAGLIPFDYNTTTDADGKFRFTCVQPGNHRVQRLIKFYKGQTGPIGFSHGQTVTVRPGETIRVVIGGEKGRAVIGQLVMFPAMTNYDWNLDMHALVQQRPDLPEVKVENFRGDHQAYIRAWSVRDSQIAKYYLAVAADGSFRTDDVLPGNYSLQVTIKAAPADPLADDAWMHFRRDIGKVDMAVVIPESDAREPLDLGVITIPITNSPPVTAR